MNRRNFLRGIGIAGVLAAWPAGFLASKPLAQYAMANPDSIINKSLYRVVVDGDNYSDHGVAFGDNPVTYTAPRTQSITDVGLFDNTRGILIENCTFDPVPLMAGDSLRLDFVLENL